MSREQVPVFGPGDVPEELTITDPALQSRVSSVVPETEEVVQPVVSPSPPTREKIRALFVTYDDATTEGSLAASRYASYGSLFEEVHVIVPTEGEQNFDGIQLAPNVWAYPTNSTAWWKYPWDAFRIASRQLTFAGSFRADVVTSSDPFELGMMAWCIAWWWKRPLVVEASERLYDPDFFNESDDNSYRAWCAKFLLPRAERVHARSTRLRDMVARTTPGRGDTIDVVPRYIDVTTLETVAPSKLLTERYPQFTFIMLVVATLGKGSGVDRALSAVAPLLTQLPTAGLIVVGNGPELETLAHDAEHRGLTGRVYFEPMPEDIVPFLQSAHMLIMLKSAILSEEILMSSAAVGLPVVVSEDVVIPDIFVHRESAMVCKENDIGCAIQSITAYVNDSVLRERCAKEARKRAHSAVASEYTGRGARLRESLEKAVVSWHERREMGDHEARGLQESS